MFIYACSYKTLLNGREGEILHSFIHQKLYIYEEIIIHWKLNHHSFRLKKVSFLGLTMFMNALEKKVNWLGSASGINIITIMSTCQN